MSSFYTNIQLAGDTILYRGYENGNPVQYRESFSPTLYVLSKNKEKFKTLDGKYAIVAPSGKVVKTFDDKKEAENWVIKNHDAVMKEEVPTNSAGGGAIAGLDIGLTHKKKQEDEKKAKALKKMMVGESVKMATFAGKDVFIVDSDMFHNCRMGKQKYHRYEKYVGSKRIGQAIREYGLKFPKRPIILQNGENGPMLYLRYGGK